MLTLAGTTYGYFDVLSNESGLNLSIGDWDLETDAIEYLNNRSPEITGTDGSVVNYLDYVADIIWSDAVYNGAGDLVSGSIRPQYASYPPEEIKRIIDTIISYTDNFLTADDSGDIVFPERLSVTQIELPFDAFLSPGESAQFSASLLAADLYDDVYWSPIMYSISIEGADGANISDFALELLYAAEYAGRFGYQYLIKDSTSYNVNRAQGRISANDNSPYYVTSEQFTDIYAYELSGSSYSKATYRHYINEPMYGEWSRFTEGAMLYLDKPSGSPIGSQQQINSNKTKIGLSLIGKANGTASELRIGFFDRGRTGDLIKNIPLIINLSRGVMLDGNGNPLDYSAAATKPVIKIRLVSGDIWGS